MEIEIVHPDDWHCHLRDDPFLATTVAIAAKHFKRAIVMPNLASPIDNVVKAKAYSERIKAHIPPATDFTPLMTLYLTQHTTAETINEAAASNFIYGCKLYPHHATTNSDNGVKRIETIYPLLAEMEKQRLPLLVHGEVTDPACDIFDREKIFIEKHLIPILKNFPELKIVFEHITTLEAVDFVTDAKKLAATITPHHLLLNRNDMLVGRIQPHLYCLPIVKRKHHQTALIQAATSGSEKFFIGTDSAPHTQFQKESCGCAGIFNHPCAISIYARIFEENQALEKLEGFLSLHGPKFYDLKPNTEKIRLVKAPWLMTEALAYDNSTLIPFMAGKSLEWVQRDTL